MLLRLFEPKPNITHAYHEDSSNNEYYGSTTKGAGTSTARWVIMKIEYTGNNWVSKYPNGDDSPKYVWDDVETYTYKILGT